MTAVQKTGQKTETTPSPKGGAAPQTAADVAIDCRVEKIFYGSFLAVRDSHVPVHKGKITGFIGPSGCGKSTVLRSLNRMNDMVNGFKLEGHVQFMGQDVYGKNVDPVVVRRYIGMVFQQPNPFSMSIYDNVAFGLRLNRFKGNMNEQGRTRAAPRRPVGRGQGQAEGQRPVALRRPAAAPVHRPRRRHRADRAVDGRAVLGARPDRDAPHRGADAGTEGRLHDRAGHPQHAAGDACRRHHRVLLPSTSRRAAAPATSWRWARRSRSSKRPASS